MLPVFSTPRLTLRPSGDEDIDVLWQLLTLPKVRRYLCDDKVLPRETVEAIIATDPQVEARGLGMWVTQRDGMVMGLAALRPVPDALVALVPQLAGEVEPTVALDPLHWGQGLASEALAALLGHGFGTLALPRIAAVCDTPNHASARMLRRAGFRETGEHPGPHYRVLTWTKDRG
jgi:ribosomal-protein-alanine N-acetyltransferase